MPDPGLEEKLLPSNELGGGAEERHKRHPRQKNESALKTKKGIS
jgi:hypothetical protein